MQGASLQCMHATEMLFSPGTPSLSVTTRRRFTPHGISCSCLQAVTQPLHSMQRSASHKNFILAMVKLLLLAAAPRFARHSHDTPRPGERLRGKPSFPSETSFPLK